MVIWRSLVEILLSSIFSCSTQNKCIVSFKNRSLSNLKSWIKLFLYLILGIYTRTPIARGHPLQAEQESQSPPNSTSIHLLRSHCQVAVDQPAVDQPAGTPHTQFRGLLSGHCGVHKLWRGHDGDLGGGGGHSSAEGMADRDGEKVVCYWEHQMSRKHSTNWKKTCSSWGW